MSGPKSATRCLLYKRIFYHPVATPLLLLETPLRERSALSSMSRRPRWLLPLPSRPPPQYASWGDASTIAAGRGRAVDMSSSRGPSCCVNLASSAARITPTFEVDQSPRRRCGRSRSARRARPAACSGASAARMRARRSRASSLSTPANFCA